MFNFKSKIMNYSMFISLLMSMGWLSSTRADEDQECTCVSEGVDTVGGEIVDLEKEIAAENAEIRLFKEELRLPEKFKEFEP